jgi:hypothetical protein
VGEGGVQSPAAEDRTMGAQRQTATGAGRAG